MTLATSRRWPRLRAAACRHWCRTARPSARRPRRRPWRRPARSRDWPCSRRRNARNRAALPAAAFAASTLSRMPSRFSSSCAERDADLIVPRLGHEADRVGLRPPAARRRPDRWRPSPCPLGHAEGGELRPAFVGLVAKNRVSADWRRDSRPRHSRCRARRACRRSARLSSSEKSTPSSARRRAASCRRDKAALSSFGFRFRCRLAIPRRPELA
jgi:hypothetical protein